MDRIIRHISLDFQRQTSVRVVFANQHDFNSQIFLITLYNDGVEFPLPKEVLAVMNILRPDGESAEYICEIQNDGKAKYTLGPWPLLVPGEARFSLSLYDGEEKKLTTGSFIVDIAPIPYTGEEIEEDSEAVTIFEEMMDSFANVHIEENKRKNAEIIRLENERVRNVREQIRESNENYRDEIAKKVLDGLDGMLAIQNKFISQSVSISTTLQMLDMYPVGSVYISAISTDPGTLFGGKWERLKDRFLLGAGSSHSAGTTGGSADSELIQHSHSVLSVEGNPIFLKEGTDASGLVMNGVPVQYASNGADSSWKIYSGLTGTLSNGLDKNMPPYLTVYMWKRVS